MAVTSIDAAKYICKRGDWQVTNLALQKILYLIQMVHLGRTGGQRLFQGHFQAWDYGPVEPTVYHLVSMFGSRPIKNIFQFNNGKEIQDGNILGPLDEGCNFLLKKNPFELVAMTHWDDGAWAKCYVPGAKNIEIPDDLILEEYRNRADGQ
jgi:uncharacterized phage-associated protein